MGLAAMAARWVRNCAATVRGVAIRRQALQIGWTELPAVTAIGIGYYSLFFAGEVATWLSPGWMTRRFRI